ncbi:MAG: ATP synthase F1 subunit gamma [Planctomycetota bacterium]
MPANIREIKGRIKAVGNIERITKTMQLIASARFQSMQKKATRSQAYTAKLGEMVGELVAALGTGGGEEIDHPLISAPGREAGRRNELVLTLTSERGLCGAYNGNVMRKAQAYLRDELGFDDARLEVVGKKGQAYAKFNRLPVAQPHTFGDDPAYGDVEQLAQRFIDEFVAGRYAAVKVVYMKFVSMSRQVPTVQTLLPLEPPQADDADSGGGGDAPGEPASIYEFSPDAASMLAELLPVTVKTTLFQCFLDAVVSEQLARMVAMKAATDAAGKQKTSLKRQFNRARQTAITTELSEIIGGAAALE